LTLLTTATAAVHHPSGAGVSGSVTETLATRRKQRRGAAVEPGDSSRPRRAAHTASPSSFSYITQPSTGAIPARS
jgi:hypothetical protein